MTSRLAAVVLVLGSACAALPFASAQPEAEVVKEDTVNLPLGKDHWSLQSFDRDPVKLVKYTAVKRTVRVPPVVTDPERPGKPQEQTITSVDFILEFTRDVTVRDTAWTGVRPEPPFRFDFLDKDGVTLVSQPARYEGLPVGRMGRRVRVVLALPPERVLSRTERVLVEPKAPDLP